MHSSATTGPEARDPLAIRRRETCEGTHIVRVDLTINGVTQACTFDLATRPSVSPVREERGPQVSAGQTVLLVGGTGRTGRHVLERLLARGVRVRAVVRSAGRLPKGVAGDRRLTVVEGDLLSLSGEDLVVHVRGCSAVISCLGHLISLKGVLGPPHDLVTRASARLCQAIRDSQPGAPVKYLLLSSVSVNHPGAPEARRGTLEKLLLWVLRGLVPPARDNQRAAAFLHGEIRAGNPLVQWVAVRPDTLLEGGPSAYSVHEHLVGSLFRPNRTNMANVADFMCDLVTDPDVWDRWAGRLPVIVNGPASSV